VEVEEVSFANTFSIFRIFIIFIILILSCVPVKASRLHQLDRKKISTILSTPAKQ